MTFKISYQEKHESESSMMGLPGEEPANILGSQIMTHMQSGLPAGQADSESQCT